MRGERQQSELISFLQTENKTLRQENTEFKNLIQLNRQALKIALNTNNKEDQIPTLVNLVFEENTKLLDRCKQLKNELQVKSCQVLISEQIVSESNEHEKYVASQLKERLKLLKKEIQTKDRKITQLSKQFGKSDHLDREGRQIQTMVIQFTQMNKVSEKLFKEGDSLRREVELKIQEVQKLKEQKEELIKLNLILTNKVNELKAYSLQTTSSHKRQFNTSTTDLSKFLKYQSKIATGSDGESQQAIESDDEEKDSDYSELDENSMEEQQEMEQQQVQVKQKPKFTLNLNLKKEESQKSEKPSQVIPKLQLKKARQIQSLIIKKINNDEKKKQGNQNKDEKTRKWQAEVDQLRKRLGNQIILKLRYQKENSFLKKFIAELEQRNELLLHDRHDKSLESNYQKQRNEHYEENVETILDICRDVTLNQKLKKVLKGHQTLLKKQFYSKDV